MRTFLALSLSAALLAQQSAPPPQNETPTFKASANLVIVTAFVRDRQGQPLPDLKKEDFIVLENGKPQSIAVFEFQKLAAEKLPELAEKLKTRDPQPAAASAAKPAPEPEGRERFRDKRLIVLFFDWTSMQALEQARAKDAAEKFVREQMTTSDLVSIVTFGSKLKTDVEFTNDRELLLATIARYQAGVMSELAIEGATDVEQSEDSAFEADDSEFNIFNTDRKLSALEQTAQRLAVLPEKKALVYFSSGVGRTGVENQSQLRATINAAVRSNVSFYPVDARGLQALPPGGDATQGGGRGTGLYSGQAQGQQRQRANEQQETLFALAADTGGKALLDDNDLTLGMQRAQQDMQSYYILGYYSTDERRDGRYRRVEVKLASNTRQARIDYRRGYFAEKEFAAFNSTDKERQLEDALTTGDPITDIPIALEVNWFRIRRDSFFVPVAVKIPGSAIPLAAKGGGETTTFDFIGEIRDSRRQPVSMVRDNIKIQLREEKAGKLAQRSLLYDTGFTLQPGDYKVRMLVRENLTGKMGTFETSVHLPKPEEYSNQLAHSTIVWSAQREAVKNAVGVASKREREQKQHPLVRGDRKLIPSVTRVFRQDQTVTAYLEVYDAAPVDAQVKQPSIAASVSFFRDGHKVLETAPLHVRTSAEKRPNAALVEVDVPLKGLPVGPYVAQVNLIDEAGKRFAFPRTRIVIVRAGNTGQSSATAGE